MTDPADELRRRLYRLGATAEDLDAYREAVAGAEADAPAAQDPAAPPSRRRRRLPIVAAAVGIALAGSAAVVWTTRPSAPMPTPMPTATSADASASSLALQALPGDAAERTAFVRALVEGGSAGLGQWLDQRAPDLPGALATATRSETIEFTGDGDRTVRLSPISLGNDGGHATVLLVAAVDTRAGFVVASPVLRDGRIVRLVGGPIGRGELRAGVPVGAQLQYDQGVRPATLRVIVPDGVRWGAAVVFSD